MTEEKLPLPERMDRFIKRLQGVKPRKDPRKEENPLFAGFQDRVIASVIDMALIYLLLQGVFHFITARVFRYADMEKLHDASVNAPQDADTETQIRYFVDSVFESGLFDLWMINSLLQSVIIGIVLVILWSQFHCTPGKFIIGLEFAGRGGEGKPTLKQYIIRFLGFYLSMPIFMIGFIWLGFDKKKRAWHDLLAGTTVIYSKRGSIFRQAWDWVKGRF